MALTCHNLTYGGSDGQYPYNYGAAVVGIHFGNHVGDWEHTMVRFRFGAPVYVHMSAHSDGHSYKYDL